MTVLTKEEARIIGGAATHACTLRGVAINPLGRALGDCEFPTTPAGSALLWNFWELSVSCPAWVSRAPVPPVLG
ncbi:hypothetical protein [Rhodococcus globerulus]|uniref:hypothetical protein n=1 Tax=Rhodococcus globerulus TaxID=33008 RepID=UPI001C569163|nr:hypothetical protein [Rhodococcus globerulus]QXW01354.1 hypothetical protein KYT97_23915 [Rhodococcus globerulus]